MDKLLTVMNFSHVYENEKFYLSEEYNWVDCTNIIGTNGYCDESALVVLKEKVQAIKAEGIHFIDSGNYHYISHLWLEKIVEDFILVVFDHHSDMMRPAFGDILSSGSWLMEEIKSNTFIKKVLIIGLSKEQKEAIPKEYLDKVICICEEEVAKWSEQDNLLIDLDNLPVYISIDKDVLNKETVNTSWDQGKMSLNRLKLILYKIIKNKDVIGIDICGENQESKMKFIKNNDMVNSEILNFCWHEAGLSILKEYDSI